MDLFINNNFSLKQIVDLPRETHFADETTSFSAQWRFDNGGPLLPRGLEYGDEIPSL